LFGDIIGFVNALDGKFEFIPKFHCRSEVGYALFLRLDQCPLELGNFVAHFLDGFLSFTSMKGKRKKQECEGSEYCFHKTNLEH